MWGRKPTMPGGRRLKPEASNDSPEPGASNESRETTTPEARSPKPEASPQGVYVAALRMLARRELSERQIRERLRRKGHEESHIESAVSRLKSERALDDARVAEAIARTETVVKRRGKLRVKRQIEQAGIAADVARQALDAVFGETDADALLQAALARRLRGDRPIADDREFQRLYRYLAAQGFESDQILKALNARRGRPSADDFE